MRRSAIALSLLCTSLTITGCNDPKENGDMQDAGQTASMDMQPDYYATDPAGASVGQDSYTTYPSTTLTAVTPVESSVNATGTHTVSKGDTLYRLARNYYNDQSRWKEIYEANRDQLANPDRISIGQQLVIP